MPQDNLNSTEHPLHALPVHILWSLIIRTEKSARFPYITVEHLIKMPTTWLTLYHCKPHMLTDAMVLFQTEQITRLKNANSLFCDCPFQHVPAAGESLAKVLENEVMQ